MRRAQSFRSYVWGPSENTAVQESRSGFSPDHESFVSHFLSFRFFPSTLLKCTLDHSTFLPWSCQWLHTVFKVTAKVFSPVKVLICLLYFSDLMTSALPLLTLFYSSLAAPDPKCMYLPKGLFAWNALSSVTMWHTALPSWLYLPLCKVFLNYLIQIWIPLPGFPNPFPAIFFFIVLSAYKILNSVLTYFCFFCDSMYPTGILALKG